MRLLERCLEVSGRDIRLSVLLGTTRPGCVFGALICHSIALHWQVAAHVSATGNRRVLGMRT